jgi:sugar lactone lactonase YvrE
LDLTSGAMKTIAGTGKAGFGGDGGPAKAASFNITMTGTLSPDGKRILVADIGNHRVREIDLADGAIKTIAGNGQKGNPADGTDALQAPMGDARAVTQASDGTLYIILRGGNSLVEVKDGKARTVVNASGKKGYGGDGGDGREALMNGPKYVAMDKEGNVLICDTENHCVRRYFPKTGKIELVAGSPEKAGTTLGTSFLKTALRRPHGVRAGPDDKLYIADTYNNRVLRGENR